MEIPADSEMRRLLLAGLLTVCTLTAQPKPGAASIQGQVLHFGVGDQSDFSGRQVDRRLADRGAGERPGKYRLFAWEEVDDDLWPDPEFHGKYESRASDVRIGQDRTVPRDRRGCDEVSIDSATRLNFNAELGFP